MKSFLLFVVQRQGAWRTLVDKVKGAKARGSLTTPVEELNYSTYHLLALMKLRSYGAAADELAAVGDLDATQYRYEEYPSVYPDKSGNLFIFFYFSYVDSRNVPFADGCWIRS